VIWALLTLLAYLLAFGVVWWAVDYTIIHLPVPNPPANFIRIALVIVCAIIMVALILSMVGTNVGIDLPRLG
jgi:hypothetical protein